MTIDLTKTPPTEKEGQKRKAKHKLQQKDLYDLKSIRERKNEADENYETYSKKRKADLKNPREDIIARHLI